MRKTFQYKGMTIEICVYLNHSNKSVNYENRMNHETQRRTIFLHKITAAVVGENILMFEKYAQDHELQDYIDQIEKWAKEAIQQLIPAKDRNKELLISLGFLPFLDQKAE